MANPSGGRNENSPIGSAAFAVLAYALTQPAWAAETAAVVDAPADVVTTATGETVATSTAPSPTLLAQNTPAGPPTAPTMLAQAEDTGPENVIVSATRRETFLQDTPIAIAVANTEFLEKQHVTSLIDLASGSLPFLRIAT